MVKGAKYTEKAMCEDIAGPEQAPLSPGKASHRVFFFFSRCGGERDAARGLVCLWKRVDSLKSGMGS